MVRLCDCDLTAMKPLGGGRNGAKIYRLFFMICFEIDIIIFLMISRRCSKSLMGFSCQEGQSEWALIIKGKTGCRSYNY